MPDQSTLELIGAIAGAATILGAVTYGVSKLVRFLRRAGHFLDDWFGEPARDGVEERPGVMARLQAEEEATTELRESVTGLTEQIGRQPQHIDQLCEEMKTQLREERQEVITAALGQHVSAFHPNPQGQA